MDTIHSRIMAFAKYKGYSSEFTFMRDGLNNYPISIIQRIRKKGCLPGRKFLMRLVECFPEIDLNFILTGKPTNLELVKALKECWKQNDFFESQKIIEEALKDHFYFDKI